VTREEVEELTFNDEQAKALRWILDQYIANTRGRTGEADWLAPQVYSAAIEFLRENAGGPKPFFLVVDHFDPHEPWDPPQHYTDLYDPGYQGRGKRGTHDRYGPADWLTERELKHMRALYAGEVTMCDTWLGKFLDALEELRLMERTLILFISDHGHSLGEHNLTGKIPWAMYPELIDLPALYWDPQLGGGKTVGGLVYNVDLVTTAMNRLGATATDPLDGIDVRPMIEGGHGGRPYVTSAFKDFVYVRRGRHVMICHFKGSRHQLFDVERDPGHQRNIADRNRDLCDELFGLALEDAGGELPVYEGHTTFADGSEEAESGDG
jgi:arylsulfatase A-like enzyme